MRQLFEAPGVPKCETLVATSVVASSYMPGASNVWYPGSSKTGVDRLLERDRSVG